MQVTNVKKGGYPQTVSTLQQNGFYFINYVVYKLENIWDNSHKAGAVRATKLKSSVFQDKLASYIIREQTDLLGDEAIN